jgi:hypothetical protein
MLGSRSTLYTKDAAVREIALLAGVARRDEMILTLDAVEHVFQGFAAMALGSHSSRDARPTDARLAAVLLILRESMHHLQFASIIVEG